VGGIVDRGLSINIYSEASKKVTPFDPASIVCGTRPLRREVGCIDEVTGPPDNASIGAMFDRNVYDTSPYDACGTDETVSFRQYLEGFTLGSTSQVCVAAGCEMHGRGHIYVGGDMFTTSTNPNDPVFFLHHAQVDRMWAAWQEANIQLGAEESVVDAGNPGYPDMSRVPLFNWGDVEAEEMFDYQAQGYTYDSLPSPG
jgi:tyrosinase